jgi:hypothetical protein
MRDKWGVREREGDKPEEESEARGVEAALELTGRMVKIDGAEADLTWYRHLKEECPFAG